jgi:hypothetical protein
MRILGYIGFLGIYILFLIAGFLTLRFADRPRLLEQANLLLSLLAIFGFPFVLAGYFDPLLATVFLLVSEIGILLSIILGSLFGSANSTVAAKAAQQIGMELAVRYPGLIKCMSWICCLIAIGFPIAIAVNYFSLPDTELAARVLQYTFCMLFLTTALMIYPTIVYALVSENLGEDMRNRIFVNQLSGLVPTALQLAMIFWSFNIVGHGVNLHLGSASLVLSPLLAGILVGFFLLIVVLPYLVGGYRSKRWRAVLLNKQLSWSQRIMEILEKPDSERYRTDVDGFQNAIQEEMSGLERDHFFDVGNDTDPRSQYLNGLRGISKLSDEIRVHLEKIPSGPDLDRAVRDWRFVLVGREQKLSKELDDLKSAPVSSVAALGGIVSVISAVVSVLSSDGAKWLWEHFLRSAAQ